MGLVTRLLANRRLEQDQRTYSVPGKFLASAASLVLVGLVAWLTWQDYRIDPPLTHEAEAVPVLKQAAPEIASRGAAAVLVAADDSETRLEAINSTEYRLQLDKVYRFVDLSSGSVPVQAPHRDPRPLLYTGGLLDHIGTPASIPGFCSNTYFVEPSLEERFRRAFESWHRVCDHAPEYVFLPQ